jgi:hypothetical protein
VSSRDIEDVVQVLDGRMEIADGIRDSDESVRAYVAGEFTRLLSTSAFRDAISAHLLPDAANQAREAIVVERMVRIASVG